MTTLELIDSHVFKKYESTHNFRDSDGELLRLDYYKNTIVTTNYNIDNKCYSFTFKRGIFQNHDLVEGYEFHVDEYNEENESDFDSKSDFDGADQGYQVMKFSVRDSTSTILHDDLVFEQKKNCAYKNCNLPFSRMKCARCGVYYHSRTCQRADWPAHKVQCRKAPQKE